MTVCHRVRDFIRDERGASAAEFAMVLPVVLILFFGAIASALMMYVSVDLQHATETSARCLSAQRTDDCTVGDVTTFAESYYKSSLVSDLEFTAAWDTACGGYKVTGSGTYNMFAGFGMLSVPISTSACYPGIDPT